MKLQERQGVTAGIVLSIFMTVLFTSTALEGQRTETFVKTLGSCIIAVGVVWFFVHRFKKTQDHPKR